MNSNYKFVMLSLLLIGTMLHSAQAQVKHTEYWVDEKLLISDSGKKNEIDPRQYVRVLYKKNPNYKQKEGLETQRVIWNWNDTGYFQKFKVLDNEGFLSIYFKKEELAQNYNFQGNISLEANLKGKDGERKIEVSPYSMVGVDRKEIGIQSFPPTTVAQVLFNTIIEMKRTIVSVQFVTSADTLYGYNDDIASLKAIIDLIEKEHRQNMNQTINPSDNILETIRYYTDYDPNYYRTLKKYVDQPASYTYSDLNSAIRYIYDDYNKFLAREAANFERDLKFLLRRLTLINSYLSSFKKAGADAVKAFLEISSKDKINFDFLVNELAIHQTDLDNLLRNSEVEKDPRVILSSRDNLRLALQIMEDLKTFSAINGSKLEALARKYVKASDVLTRSGEIKSELEEEYGSIHYKAFSENFTKLSDTSYVENKYSRFILLRLLEKSGSFEQFKRELSVMAAEIIYRKLVFASIDLGRSGAQPGDILYLSVVWKNIDGDTTINSSSLLPIGKYYLRQTGWRTEISESFYLVERLNEPSNDPNLSKSNFKGTYGASIMRTFYYSENFEKTFAGRCLNWLQPSIGFNISYLDFYTTKDIEIGAAIQLGLFKNIFFFGSGINLHSIRGDEKKSAAFFMFGVSFTNIAAKFKNNDKNTPNQ